MPRVPSLGWEQGVFFKVLSLNNFQTHKKIKNYLLQFGSKFMAELRKDTSFPQGSLL